MTVDQLLAYCRPFYPTWDADLCRELVEQFEMPRRTKLAHLSRGMRVKAALVSSLAYRPRLLVLDEPFSGLDPAVRDDLVRGVLTLAGQEHWTVLVSSHDLDDVERLWSSPLLAIAVLTRRLTRYLMTIAGAVATLAAVIAVTVIVVMLRDVEDVPTGEEVSLPDPTIGLITGLAFVAAIMAVVGYQYYRPRRGRAIVVAALGLVAVAVLANYWPWSLAATPPTRDVVMPDTAGIAVNADMGSPRAYRTTSG